MLYSGYLGYHGQLDRKLSAEERKACSLAIRASVMAQLVR